MKNERLQALQALLTEQQSVFNQSCAGRELSVLFEKPGRRQGQAVGRSPYLQPVHVDGAAPLIGELRTVKIIEVLPNSLRGALADATHTAPKAAAH